MAKVTMPQLGESVTEGTIGKWLKKPGDHVARYEPLLEVITDKVNAEVPSPFEGTLTEILVQEGETVPNNAEIAVIEETAAPAASPAAPAASSAAGAAGAAAAAPTPAPGPVTSPPAASMSGASAAAIAGAVAAAPTSGLGDPDARMSPAVRRLLRENNLGADQIPGTGGGGRITRDDVAAFLAARATGAPDAPAAAPAPATGPAPASAGTPARAAAPAAPAPVTFAPGQDEQLVPWSQMRKGIAAAMLRSKTTVPHAGIMVEADATNLVRLRAVQKDAFRAREGANLSYVPFMVKAVVEALRKHPQMNAHWTADGLLVKRRINVGIAVAVPDGLIVPVIQDADQLSISGLNRAVLDLAERARTKRLRLDDLQGGTITVNNTGAFGSVVAASIINSPEIAIVNLEAIVKRPVVLETADGDVIAVRSMLNVPVTFDHRATDGAQVARFVNDIKAWIEAVGPDTGIY